MKVTKIDKLMISGISAITNNEAEFSEEGGKIPALWDEYFQKDIYKKTFNKAHEAHMYGVYSEYESDDSADYKITVGVEVTKPKNAITIDNQKYLVFSKKGEIPDVVVELWTEIWEHFSSDESKYERAFKVDFEKYLSEDEIEIYISIN